MLILKLLHPGYSNSRMLIFSKALIILCVLVSLPVLSYSGDNDGGVVGSVTLPELLESALSKNQQLISADASAQRYQTRIPLIDNLTEPLLAFYYQGFPVANMSGGTVEKVHQGSAGVATKHTGRSVRGKILTGQDMVENMALWYEYSAEDLRLQMTRQVREAFYRIYFLDRIIKVTQKSLVTLESLTEAGGTQYAVGNIRQKALLNIQKQRYLLTARLLDLEQQRQQWATTLNYLAARSVSAKIVPSIEGGLEYEDLIEPKYSVNNLISGLIHNRPLSKGYQALGARFKVMRGMAQMYFNRDVQTEAMFEADSGFRAMRAEGADFFNKTSADIQITLDNLNSYREQARLYGRVLVPQSRQIYQTNLADFKVGLGNYQETLDSLLDLDRFQVKYFEMLSNYQVDMARLEGLSGMVLNNPEQ